MSCLKNLVGIASNGCPCIDEIDTSGATLCVDDMEIGIPITWPKMATDCDDSIVGIVSTAREDAQRDFITDFNNAFTSQNRPAVKPVDKLIGKIKNNVPDTNFNSTLGGMVFAPTNIAGGTFKIKTIQLVLHSPSNPTVPRDILVYKKYDSGTFELLHTIPVVPNATTPTPITLPTGVEYYILWDVTVHGDTPLNNKAFCGGCGEKDHWASYYQINGVHGSTVDDLTKIDNRAYSIVISPEMTCNDPEAILCVARELYDYNGWYRTVAKTYQMYVIRKVIGYILNSDRLNRYTLLEREALYGKRNMLTKSIADYINWLVSDLSQRPENVQSCWHCRANVSSIRRAILV